MLFFGCAATMCCVFIDEIAILECEICCWLYWKRAEHKASMVNNDNSISEIMDVYTASHIFSLSSIDKTTLFLLLNCQ